MIFLTRERNIEEARAAVLWTGPTEQFLSEQSRQPHQRPLPPRLQEAGQTGDLRRGENSQVSQWIPRGYTGGETGGCKQNFNFSTGEKGGRLCTDNQMLTCSLICY